MSTSWQSLRRQIAQQTGQYWAVGEHDNTAATLRSLRGVSIGTFGDRAIDGFYLLLLDGEASARELRVRRYVASTGDIEFLPSLHDIPTGFQLEVLPFRPTEILNAAQVAIDQVYDNGLLTRPSWMRIIGGSPIYNADFTAWLDGVPEGWVRTGNATLTHEQSNEHTRLSEHSVGMSGAVGSIALQERWQRFMPLYYDNDDIELRCWVKSTTTSAGIGVRVGPGSAYTESVRHSGSGAWELLELRATVPPDTDRVEPVLFKDASGGVAYFNMPYVDADSYRVMQYPYPVSALPDGPAQITTGYFYGETGDVRQTLYVGRQQVMDPPRFLLNQNPGMNDEYGVLDYSLNRRQPTEDEILTLLIDAPLTKPTTILDDTLIEVNAQEALLLASYAALHILQRAVAGAHPSTVRPYTTRIEELKIQIGELSVGAGQPRNVATYGLWW